MGGSYGPTITDGVINYLSPSALTAAGPSQYGGCYMRWYMRYVLGHKEPWTAAKGLGGDVHGEIEAYLKTGIMGLGSIALSAKRYIPEPNPETQIIEGELHEVAPLMLEGVRVIGKMDLFDRGPFAVDEFGKQIIEPFWEVIDWKTSSDPVKYGKTGPQLLTTYQMTLYGMALLEGSDLEKARVSHVYMKTKGAQASFKSTALATRDNLKKCWDDASSVARTLKDVVKETDINKVPMNLDSCKAWRGCPHESYCPKNDRAQSLSELFGKTQASELQGESVMENLLDGIMDDAPKAEAPKVACDPAFAKAWEVIEFYSEERGYPPLDPEAHVQYCRLKGTREFPGAGRMGGGNGPLKDVQALSVELICKVAENLVKQAEAQGRPVPGNAPAVEAPAPAEAPPVVEATPEPTPAPEVVLKIEETAPVQRSGVVVDEAPAQIVTTNALSPRTREIVELVGAGDKMASVRKPELVTAAYELTDALASINDGQGAVIQEARLVELTPASAPVAETKPELVVHINCIPSEPFTWLDDYVRDACAELAKQAGDQDVRCSDHKALGFGKWKGALAAYVRAKPPEAGVYVIDASASEMAEVVADTLRGEADRWVRGV